MSPMEIRLLEDRAMRDSAKELVKADIAQVRSDLANRGLGDRLSARVGEGAADMADEAVELAVEHKGAISAAIAAVLLWLMRAPLIAWLFGEEMADDNEDE